MNTTIENYNMMHDKVMVRRDDPETETESGIAIVERAKSPIAVVLRVGPGRPLARGGIEPMPFKVGDRVLLHKYAGTDLTIDGQKVHITDLESIIGVFDEDEQPAEVQE